jgi:hypothetical protein
MLAVKGAIPVDVSLAFPAGFGNHTCQEAGDCTTNFLFEGLLPHSLTYSTPTHPVASHSYGNASSVLAMVHLP